MLLSLLKNKACKKINDGYKSKSYCKTVTDLRATFTKLINLLSRQVIPGRGNPDLPFLVHTSKSYDNSNWYWYMAV